ncbi:MAG: heparan-alpha-glucosaminide N-acetyltransferase domain-containing protein [Vicinamibacterales bacterium]
MIPAAATERRIVFLDFARAIATLLMLQGHTVDALLDTALRAGPVFHGWTLARGLTSATFLFVGGFAFSVVTARGWKEAAGAAGTRRRLRRFLFFLALGYALHWPAGSLEGAMALPAARWSSFLAVDVLQCIAVTLTLLQLLAIVAGSPRRFLWGAAGLCAALVALTPLVWPAAPAWPLPAALIAYLTPANGSLFPLLPSAAYGALGAALGMMYASSHQPGASLRALRMIGAIGVLMVAAGTAGRLAGAEPVGGIEMGAARPTQFPLQAGAVCLVVALIAWASRAVAHRSPPVIAIAQESLTVYFVHVCLVYGSPWNPGLRQVFGPTLSLPEVALCVVAMWSLMGLLSVGWNHYKHHQPARARYVRLAVVCALTLLVVV